MAPMQTAAARACPNARQALGPVLRKLPKLTQSNTATRTPLRAVRVIRKAELTIAIWQATTRASPSSAARIVVEDIKRRVKPAA